jgi:hypothetical protein
MSTSNSLLVSRILLILILPSGMLGIILVMPARAEEVFSLHGQLKNETAYRYIEPAAFDKILNLVRLETHYVPSETFKMTAILRSYYDAVYDFESIDNISPRKQPRTIVSENLNDEQIRALKINNLRDVEIVQKKTELREAYLDILTHRLDLRIGRQIVRWGVVEGARVTDEINPLDFQEYILREIQDRYIPLFMVKADFYADPYAFELIWIPELKFHRPAPRGSEWEQFQVLPEIRNPSKTFPNSEWAFRVSRSLAGWDLSLSYFYTWDDFPANFRTVENPINFGDPPNVVFTPRHERLRIFGTTASRGIGSLVLNGEFAYVQNKFFGLRFGRFDPATGLLDPTSVTIGVDQGEVKRDYLKWALSVDFRLFKTAISLQVQEQWIPRYRTDIIQHELETIFSLFARREILFTPWTLELLAIYFVNATEALVRPKAMYRLSDSALLTLGADIFEGQIGGPLPGEFNFVGFFRNNSRIYMELTYNF